MATAIIIAIFVTAFGLVWYSILYLLRHPDIDFHLEPQILAHEPGLEEKIFKVKSYLHNEELAEVGEIATLLDVTDEEARGLIEYLVKHGQVEYVEKDSKSFIQLI